MKIFQISYTDVMEINDLLAFNVRKYRQEKEITQKQLAEKCGVTTHHIEDIEAGRRKPSIDLLFTLASRLGIEGSLLLEQPDKESPPVRGRSRGSGQQRILVFSKSVRRVQCVLISVHVD